MHHNGVQDKVDGYVSSCAFRRMLSGQMGDLYVVRQYLDAQRGGWA